MEITNTIGRRKTSVARIYLQSGKGEIIVNNKELAKYFPSEILTCFEYFSPYFGASLCSAPFETPGFVLNENHFLY